MAHSNGKSVRFQRNLPLLSPAEPIFLLPWKTLEKVRATVESPHHFPHKTRFISVFHTLDGRIAQTGVIEGPYLSKLTIKVTANGENTVRHVRLQKLQQWKVRQKRLQRKAIIGLSAMRVN